jgi:hypothetical protein
METLILIVISLVAITLFALAKWSHRSSPKPTPYFSETKTFDGLFAPEREREAIAYARAEAELRLEAERAALLARAALGDETSLDDAHATRDRELYNETLETLLAGAEGDKEMVRTIAEHIIDGGALRSSPALARMMLEQGQGFRNSRSLADLLYVAALSDDPPIYEQAVQIAFKRRHQAHLRPSDFLAIVESSYWLISAETRYSGRGFTLKQMIAGIRRELAATARRSV